MNTTFDNRLALPCVTLAFSLLCSDGFDDDDDDDFDVVDESNNP
jgi:hypothetical protein